VISEDIYVMILKHAFFSNFTKKSIIDSHTSVQVLNCLSCESRDAVNDIVRKAEAAGGKTYAEPQDHGWMYQHGFEDLDGHIWEVAYMDITQAPATPEAAPAEMNMA
jgi:predicted lactoylglutathione lyase